MAKKKTRQQVSKKPALKLETRFDCPICNHENVVQCKITAKLKRGWAFCSVCEANFTCEVANIEKPVDIYYSWLDEIKDKNIKYCESDE